MGRCLMEMNKLSDANEYFKKALDIKQQTSNDFATDNSVAATWVVIG